MNQKSKLSADFTAELAKACLYSTKILEICRTHLKYHFLQSEAEKKIFKYIYEYTDINSQVPTIGIMGQTFGRDQDVLSFLKRVKDATIAKDQYDNMLVSLEEYIRRSRFIHVYETVGTLYSKGKHDEAIAALSKESQEIQNFALKETYYTTIFKGFEERQIKRERSEKDKALLERCTFGIHEADMITHGGPNKGTSVLLLARSGVGKSTAMRWIGLSNARLGKRVVHFQAEGTEEEVEDAYDAGWTGINTRDIEEGIIPDDKQQLIQLTRERLMATGGEIYVYASESFDSMSLNKCRDILIDVERLYGKVDMVIFDYLELFTVKGQYGSSEASERKRREDIANKITNVATEFKCVTVTATQANDIKMEKYNNPEFVLTRSEIAEFKGCLKPFSVFATLNQTDDEYDQGIMRWHFDKLRKYKKGQTIRFYQALDCGRFYDSKKTIETFYDPEKYVKR